MKDNSQIKNLELPTCDDRLLWDIWMSVYHFPALVVADELSIFSLLDKQPATTAEIAEKLSLGAYGMEALLGTISALGLVAQHQGEFYLTAVSRNFLLPSSPYYWGGVLEINRRLPSVRVVSEAMKKGSAAAFPDKGMWEIQQLNPEKAKAFTRVMHSHGFPAAMGVARHANFKGNERLLDIGGGSGCYCIALALRHPKMSFTLIELPAVCEVAKSYIEDYALVDRISVLPLDIFKQPWPTSYDAIFFSDIFHNWNRDHCRYLAKRSLESLPSGGHIYIHEILLSDTKDSPLVATAYAMQMLSHTEGKQFTVMELKELLEESGFRDISIVSSYAYYSLVSAVKP